MKNQIYLSYFIDNRTPVYGGGGSGFEVIDVRSISKGDTANTKKIIFNNHIGTHIDFPNHFFDKGDTLEKYPPSFWFFYKPFLYIIESNENDLIDIPDEILNIVPLDVDFLIIKSNFGKYRNDEKYWKFNPGIAPQLAVKLRNKFTSLRIIGVDLISISSFQNRELGRIAHRNFLDGQNPLLIIEDMDITNLYFTPKQILCFPILINNLDGAPITIIANV